MIIKAERTKDLKSPSLLSMSSLLFWLEYSLYVLTKKHSIYTVKIWLKKTPPLLVLLVVDQLFRKG